MREYGAARLAQAGERAERTHYTNPELLSVTNCQATVGLPFGVAVPTADLLSAGWRSPRNELLWAARGRC